MPAVPKRQPAQPPRRAVRKPRATASASLAAVVNVHDAKTQLSRLLARVEAGEEITIARAGRPFARLVPLTSPASANPYLALGIADAVAAYDHDHGQPETDFSEVWLKRSPPKPDPLEE